MSATVQAPDRVSLLRARITDIVQRELHVGECEEDEDGDLTFRYQGMFHALYFHEEDSSFLNLRLPAFYELNARLRRSVVMEACAEATRTVKLVKVYPWRAIDGTENVSASVEFMVSEIEELNAERLSRYLDAIQVAVHSFYEALAVANGDPLQVDLEVPSGTGRKRH